MCCAIAFLFHFVLHILQHINVNFKDALSRSVVSIICHKSVTDMQLIMTRQNFSSWAVMKISASILKIPLPSNLLEQRPSDLKLYDRQETDPNPDKLTEPCLG